MTDDRRQMTDSMTNVEPIQHTRLERFPLLSGFPASAIVHRVVRQNLFQHEREAFAHLVPSFSQRGEPVVVCVEETVYPNVRMVAKRQLALVFFSAFLRRLPLVLLSNAHPSNAYCVESSTAWLSIGKCRVRVCSHQHTDADHHCLTAGI